MTGSLGGFALKRLAECGLAQSVSSISEVGAEQNVQTCRNEGIELALQASNMSRRQIPLDSVKSKFKEAIELLETDKINNKELIARLERHIKCISDKQKLINYSSHDSMTSHFDRVHKFEHKLLEFFSNYLFDSC